MQPNRYQTTFIKKFLGKGRSIGDSQEFETRLSNDTRNLLISFLASLESGAEELTSSFYRDVDQLAKNVKGCQQWG